MKFSTLNPKLINGDTLNFDCPTCGAPYRCEILVHAVGPKITPYPPTPHPHWNVVFGASNEWDSVTVSPSINYTTAGHGKKKTCEWHGHVIDGNVLLK